MPQKTATLRRKGRNAHRLNGNPMEQLFAEHWDASPGVATGQDDERHMLDHLLSRSNTLSPPYATAVEHELAATVVQWLGSPVGMIFLASVIGEALHSRDAPLRSDAKCFMDAVLDQTYKRTKR